MWRLFSMSKIIYLSHLLESKTPSYGDRSVFQLENKRSIKCGDHANESFLHMSVHLGTHIDMPIHFYANGQSIEDFPASFWIFDHPVIIEIQPKDQIIYHEIEKALNDLPDNIKTKCDLLIVKTGMGKLRHLPKYWENNPGFSPDLYAYFRSTLPSLRVFGFDSISLTGFQNRDIGKIAHKSFLNPESPVLLLEDMKLDEINSTTQLKNVIIAPLCLAKSDGLPCTAIGVTS